MGVDPDLYQIWHSSQTGPHQLNFIGYRNPEADELIVRIRREYDFRRQVELCHRLHAIIARDQPYTFLYVGQVDGGPGPAHRHPGTRRRLPPDHADPDRQLHVRLQPLDQAGGGAEL